MTEASELMKAVTEQLQEDNSEVQDKVAEDEFGHKVLFTVFQWRDNKYSNFFEFRRLRSVLESLQEYQPRSEDVWLSSFIKNGAHWVHEIASILLSGKVESSPIAKESHMIETKLNMDQCEEIDSPRLLNTHIHPRHFPPSIYKCKIIVTIRNPLSTALSYYHHYQMSQINPVKYEGTPRQFMLSFLYGRDAVFGGKNGESVYGDWVSFVKFWWKHHKDDPNVLFIFFEEMKQDRHSVIKKISQFLGKDYSEDFFSKVMDLTNLNTMRENSPRKENGEILYTLAMPDMFRKGEIEEWKEHLSEQEVSEYLKYYHEQMKDVPDLMEKIRFYQAKL